MAKIQLNGKKLKIQTNLTINDLIKKYKLKENKIAIEVNGVILPKNSYKNKKVKNNDKIEIVQFIGGGQMRKDIFKIGKRVLNSRLIVGTGKYKNFKQTADAVKASGADMVTVAVRRVNILDKKKPILTDYLNHKKIIYLPNTAGCFTCSKKTYD